MVDLLLGLIGDNISRSRAPTLHRLAGAMAGLDVRYDRLIPKDQGKEFNQVFQACMVGGYRGINVTYPYKEVVAAKVQISDRLVCSMGAVNTVLFEDDGPTGFNTDYSGFMAAYERQIGKRSPGSVLLIGAGGVGKAIAFGLVALNASSIHIVDRDAKKADELARSLAALNTEIEITAESSTSGVITKADGVVNCTPIGMNGYEGTPLDPKHMTGAKWAFDAVYTPVNTQFLQDARAAGLQIINGYELFFFQGLHAWKLFSGQNADETALRNQLLEDERTMRQAS